MEDNRPNQDLTNQDIEFIKEKVKEKMELFGSINKA